MKVIQPKNRYCGRCGKMGHNRRSCLIAALLSVVLMSGCTYATVELRHTSHPFAGPPFGPKSEEDSLNTANACAGRSKAGIFLEHCLGYKLSDGGFYGPEVTYDVRAGVRFEWGN